MRNLILFYTIFLLTICKCAISQNNNDGRISRLQYIQMYYELAIKEMIKTGIPASITLAQGAFESDDGNSYLAKFANNHFGIKCKGNWTGDSVKWDDDEKNECFRKYNSVLDSYNDHSEFLANSERYAFLFDLDKTDYKGWAEGLKKPVMLQIPNIPRCL